MADQRYTRLFRENPGERNVITQMLDLFAVTPECTVEHLDHHVSWDSRKQRIAIILKAMELGIIERVESTDDQGETEVVYRRLESEQGNLSVLQKIWYSGAPFAVYMLALPLSAIFLSFYQHWSLLLVPSALYVAILLKMRHRMPRWIGWLEDPWNDSPLKPGLIIFPSTYFAVVLFSLGWISQLMVWSARYFW